MPNSSENRDQGLLKYLKVTIYTATPLFLTIMMVLFFVAGLVVAGVGQDWKIIPATMYIYLQTLRTIEFNYFTFLNDPPP